MNGSKLATSNICRLILDNMYSYWVAMQFVRFLCNRQK